MFEVFPQIDLVATGARIKAVREMRGITVSELKEYLGFNEPVAIYKWQRGTCLPTIDNLYAMSRLFGCRVDDLLVGNHEEIHPLQNAA